MQVNLYKFMGNPQATHETQRCTLAVFLNKPPTSTLSSSSSFVFELEDTCHHSTFKCFKESIFSGLSCNHVVVKPSLLCSSRTQLLPQKTPCTVMSTINPCSSLSYLLILLWAFPRHGVRGHVTLVSSFTKQARSL